MQISGDLLRSRAKKGSLTTKEQRTFKAFWYNASHSTTIELITRPRALARVTTAKISCRDQFVSSVVKCLQEVNVKLPNMKFYSNDANLAFDVKSNGIKYMFDYAVRAVLGETNRDFTPLASPFIIRYAEGIARTKQSYGLKPNGDYSLEEIRAALKGKTEFSFFLDLMIKADDEGVRLNENMMEAWSVSDVVSYAMLGLSNLKNSKAKTTMQKSKTDWPKVFPPQVLL